MQTIRNLQKNECMYNLIFVRNVIKLVKQSELIRDFMERKQSDYFVKEKVPCERSVKKVMLIAIWKIKEAIFEKKGQL